MVQLRTAPPTELEITQPQRIQRKRTKGWKMPPNTVCVTRPGNHGNPFKVGGWFKMGNGNYGFTWLQRFDEVDADIYGFTLIKTKAQAVQWYRRYRELYPFTNAETEALRGRNIACFCPLTDPCHGDVILELVNAKIG
jgi:hypothetical protein